jgi:putative two-component system response regulator
MSEQEEILVVDDTPLVIQLLEETLSAEGFRVRSADNGELALNLIADNPPHLILLDIRMPGLDGFEVCRRLKALDKNEIPVLIISGVTSAEEKVRGFELGAVDFIPKPFQREELLARVRTHLELRRLRTKLEAQVAERTAQLSKLTEEFKQSLEKLRKSMEGIIMAVALIVEARDPYTAGHQRRVADLARTIAQEMGLPEDQVDGLRMAGMIHDLGKIAVPAEILSKPTNLSKLEFNLIKVHSEAGYNILKDINFPWPIARMVLEHHERIDGSGYPNGLTGDELLLETKILSVADVVEAIASHRPYRPAFGLDAALEEISKNRGKLYDPEVVDVCLKLFREKKVELE